MEPAWNQLTSWCLSSQKNIAEEDLTDLFCILQQNQFMYVFHEWFFETFSAHLKQILLPQFWSTVSRSKIDESPQDLYRAFDVLFQSMTIWLDNSIIKGSFANDGESYSRLQTRMKNYFSALTLAEQPPSFNVSLLATYSKAFRGFDENCEVLDEAFVKFNTQLRDLDLLKIFAEDAITSVIHSDIEERVKERCQGNFEDSCINDLQRWINKTVITWTHCVYKEVIPDEVERLKERLSYFLYETYAQTRMDQLFDIIIEYPDSEPALEDLNVCLEKFGNFRGKLISSLKESLEKRLLHPGVSTTDVLAAYISAIKALRVLDPTGVILQLVCEPVRKYLKCRTDTVSCIIHALTDDGQSDLAPEFAKSTIQSGDEVNYNSDDEAISENWQEWMPDPIDAGQAFGISKTFRSCDLISTLVNIYESKDLFVEEYQRQLAQRLLNNFDCNMENERRKLELLTLRFGESDLHACEVMLKDVTSSKRISQRINAGEIENCTLRSFSINAMILSAQFWPERPTNEELAGFRLPNEVVEGTEIFTKAFETIKGSRTLNWTPHVGQVEIELEFNENKLNFVVDPIQATIIWHFQERNTWTVNELSETLQIPPSILRRRIAYWQNRGILKETKNDIFVLIEDHVHSVQQTFGNDAIHHDDDFDDLAMDTHASQGQDNDKFVVYWSFVENMLQNLNSLSLERILSMLQMFAMQGNNSDELTVHELRHFLESKVREQKLVFAGGLYTLPDS